MLWLCVESYLFHFFMKSLLVPTPSKFFNLFFFSKIFGNSMTGVVHCDTNT